MGLNHSRKTTNHFHSKIRHFKKRIFASQTILSLFSNEWRKVRATQSSLLPNGKRFNRNVELWKVPQKRKLPMKYRQADFMGKDENVR